MKRFAVGSVSIAACAMCLALSCQPAFATEADGMPSAEVGAASADAAIIRVIDEPATLSTEDVDALIGDSLAAKDGEGATNGSDDSANDAAKDGDSDRPAGENGDKDDGSDKDSTAKDNAVAPSYNGWITDETGTYFYKDGVKVTGDQIIGGKIYHFDEETGVMARGWSVDESGENWRYFSPETGILQRGETYLPAEGAAEDGTGAATADTGKRYWYYLDEVTGVRAYGWQYVESGAKWAYYDAETGRRISGQQYVPCGNEATDESHWYYFDKATGATQYGWQWLADDTKWVYYEPTFGWMSYGEQYIPCDNAEGAPSSWYYFNPVTGAVTYGWQWLNDAEKWVCYEQVTGKMLYGQQFLHANEDDPEYHWYLFDEETGAAAHGLAWVSEEHKGALYDLTMGWMLYGWHDVDGVSYHLREGDGALIGMRCANAYVSNYVTWMLSMAADDSHGYDQEYRWGERGDYDCSSLIVSALRVAGLETADATYTGNMVYNLTRNDFVWLGDFSNLQVGDILLNETYHTAVYLGGGLLVHASGNEWGGARGGQPGDQTGTEICVRSYFWEPWDGFLRYVG